MTIGNWGKAIGAFERTLITPGRFDEYLAGNRQVLSEPERYGLRTFINTGCGSSHLGAVLGGTMFQKFGMVPPYFHDGSAKTLPEAVRIMAKVQLGKTLSAQDTSAIVTFLRSLTGKVPPQFAEAPVLPPAAFAPAPAPRGASAK